MTEFERPLTSAQASNVAAVAGMMVAYNHGEILYAQLSFMDSVSGNAIAVELCDETVRVFSPSSGVVCGSYATLDEFKAAYACGT